MNKDAILVIDGGIHRDATLTTISIERVREGIRVYRQGIAEKMVMSGGGRGPATQLPAAKTEAQAMKDYALEASVDAKNILLEEKSKDLLGNAYFSKTLYLEPLGWKNIAVIISDYQAERAKYVFKKILGDGYIVDFFQAEHPLVAEEISQLLMEEKRKFDMAKEWLGRIKDGDSAAIKDFMAKWHPAYAEHQKISTIELKDRMKDF